MSDPRTVAPKPLAGSARAVAVINTIGMTVLFGSEFIFLTLALDWAIAGLLDLPAVIYLPLGAIPMVGALVATAWIARRTWNYERYEKA